MPADTIKSNIPEYSVSDLAAAVKGTLEGGFSHIRVRGELSRVKIHTSGHMYSTLKDDQANLDVVCWRGTLSKSTVQPEEGLEVICTGRISTYPARSNYQMIIESMELAGEGALLKMLEQRRKKLQAEGLFDPERKKPLPFLPDVIGVVTSPTGAVIRDIMHRIQDRFPRPVYLWPVIVQGDGAADQITAAIHGFNAIDGNGLVPRPDVLIIGRGGGSLEDLMPFNDENVVRAIAASQIPTISAVGHETDTTLADFAADKRAPTPTAAAEMAVPQRLDLHHRLTEMQGRLQSAMGQAMRYHQEKIGNLQARLGNPQRYLESKSQGFDYLDERLNASFSHYLGQKSREFDRHAARLTHPRILISNACDRLEDRAQRLENAGKRIIPPFETALQNAYRMLESLSYHRVLDRGFAVLRDEDGQIISAPAQIGVNQRAVVTLKDNANIAAVLNPDGSPLSNKNVQKPMRSAKKSDEKKKKPSISGQHSLF